MRIDHEFTVSVPIEQAWSVLTGLAGIAPCLPGAQLTGSDGDGFTGRVKIKVGPVTPEYAGTASFLQSDSAAYHAVIDAKGKDPRGAGNASALITARLAPHGEHTTVTVETDLKITGKIAQLGSGMIKEVSEKLVGQFVVNLETILAATENVPAGPDHAAPSDAAGGAAPARAVAVGPDVEALDLMALAGGAAYKRLIAIAVAVVAAAVIIFRLVR
jgi:carbon monoxide dehydrogenase subunit G